MTGIPTALLRIISVIISIGKTQIWHRADKPIFN